MSIPNDSVQPYWRIGQEASSGDCAYFCGYILGLVRQHPNSPDHWMLSRNQVYTARDAYLHPGQPPSLRLQGRFAWAHQVPGYLASPAIGATGYHHHANIVALQGNRAPTEAEFLQSVDSQLIAGYGVMLLVGGSQADAQAGHWIAVLQKPAAGQWRWYDPAHSETQHSNVSAAADVAHMLFNRVTFLVTH
ncbi:MAG: hypothetical protein KDB00_06115 [Planctomycetales bacterium]|nr:hypothetical protein [Planctomycetales bacterium]